MFKRDKTKFQYLADQTRNPGALNRGKRANRFGAIDGYTYRGNTTAVFPTRAHGAAALMDLILYRRGKTVRSYIAGGEGVSKTYSYSGGQNYTRYLDAMAQYGVAADAVIDGSMDQLRRMVYAHRKAEGSDDQYRLTTAQMTAAFIILQGTSKHLSGTELERIEIL